MSAKDIWEAQHERELYEFSKALKDELFEDRTWRALSELDTKEVMSGHKDFKEKTDVWKTS